MPRTYEPIATQTLGSSQSNITFSSIPGTYTDLIVAGQIRGAAGDNLVLRFNSDTGSNYSHTTLWGNGSTAASLRRTNGTFSYIIGEGLIPTAANTFATVLIHINNYSNTTTNKTLLARSGTLSSTNPEVSLLAGLWRSTAAITTVGLITPGGSYLAADSTFTLYGIKAAV
jgi:hypothetical protein